MSQTHRQNVKILFGQTQPRHLWCMPFCFFCFVIYSGKICFVYFICTEQESTIPAPLDSAEEESEGELQGAKPSEDKVKEKINGGY